MGEAKRRGTYEQRKAESIACHKRILGDRTVIHKERTKLSMYLGVFGEERMARWMRKRNS